MSERQLGLLLACFSESKAAGKARRPLESRLREEGDVPLDGAVLKVNAKHKAAVYDPRRVLMGALTPALTWGLFGLIASGWQGLVIWAVVGAICGGPYVYYALRHATKAELKNIGKHLPAESSALLLFAETEDPGRVLAATAEQSPSVASVAGIADDLSAKVSVKGDGNPPSESPTVTSMIMLRYPKPDAAKDAAGRLAGSKNGKSDGAEIELIIRSDPDGRRHVADPKFGVAATAKNDIIGWGVFGVVAGAIAGASGGGVLEGGLVTGIAWAVFGAFAGALFGLWAGRGISARRLKGIGPLLAPGTSLVLAWADGQVGQEALDTLGTSQSQRLVLHFNSTAQGAVIDTA